jgi:hypothetical protein
LPLPEGLQDLESASTGQHQVEDDQVEHLGIGAKEPLFASPGADDVVVLRLQRSGKNLRQLAPVFDDQNPHYVSMLST